MRLAHTAPVLFAAAWVLMPVTIGHAQVLPREKRLAALEVAKQLEQRIDDEFESRLVLVINPFTGREPQSEGQAALVSADELRSRLQVGLRISGVGALGGRQFAFINRRRMSPGDTLRFKIGDGEVRIKLLAINARTIVVEADGLEIELPIR
jgi:hypothetical protein